MSVVQTPAPRLSPMMQLADRVIGAGWRRAIALRVRKKRKQRKISSDKIDHLAQDVNARLPFQLAHRTRGAQGPADLLTLGYPRPSAGRLKLRCKKN